MDFETLVKKKEQGLKHSLYGYSTNEVDDFLEELLIYIKSRSKESENLEIEIKKMKEHEKVISSVLVTAEKSAQAVVEKAQKNSQAILSEAEQKAHALIEAAKEETQAILTKAKIEEQKIYSLAQEETAKAKMEAEMQKRMLGNLMSALDQQGQAAYDRLQVLSQNYLEFMKEECNKEFSQLRYNMNAEYDSLKK